MSSLPLIFLSFPLSLSPLLLSPQSNCWDGDWVAGGARTQFPCPSLGMVGGTQHWAGFPQAGFYAVFLHFHCTRPEAKSRQQLGSCPKRPTPAREGAPPADQEWGPEWPHHGAFSPLLSFSVWRGGVLKSRVPWGKELPGSLEVIREIQRDKNRPRPERI